jgi:hypothetical protein
MSRIRTDKDFALVERLYLEFMKIIGCERGVTRTNIIDTLASLLAEHVNEICPNKLTVVAACKLFGDQIAALWCEEKPRNSQYSN